MNVATPDPVERGVEQSTRYGGDEGDTHFLQSAEDAVGRIHHEHGGGAEHDGARIDKRLLKRFPASPEGVADRFGEKEQRHCEHDSDTEGKP